MRKIRHSTETVLGGSSEICSDHCIGTILHLRRLKKLVGNIRPRLGRESARCGKLVESVREYTSAVGLTRCNRENLIWGRWPPCPDIDTTCGKSVPSVTTCLLGAFVPKEPVTIDHCSVGQANCVLEFVPGHTLRAKPGQGSHAGRRVGLAPGRRVSPGPSLCAGVPRGPVANDIGPEAVGIRILVGNQGVQSTVRKQSRLRGALLREELILQLPIFRVRRPVQGTQTGDYGVRGVSLPPGKLSQVGPFFCGLQVETLGKVSSTTGQRKIQPMYTPGPRFRPCHPASAGFRVFRGGGVSEAGCATRVRG